MTKVTKTRKPVGERGAVFDRELDDLPQELRWREWMGRIEAMLFARVSPVGGKDVERVVGQGGDPVQARFRLVAPRQTASKRRRDG